MPKTFTPTARDLADRLDATALHRIADWCDWCANSALGLDAEEERRFAILRDAIAGIVEMQPES